MATRRELRIKVMQILYRADLENLNIIDVLNDELFQMSEDIIDVKKYCEDINYNLLEIDELIKKNLHKYTMSRLNVVDREIKHGKKVEILESTDKWLGVTYKEDNAYLDE